MSDLLDLDAIERRARAYDAARDRDGHLLHGPEADEFDAHQPGDTLALLRIARAAQAVRPAVHEYRGAESCYAARTGSEQAEAVDRAWREAAQKLDALRAALEGR